MSDLKDLRKISHGQLLETRQVDFIIQSDEFEVAWANSSPDERIKLRGYITERNKIALKNYVTTKIYSLSPFHQMRVRELRKICRNLNIRNFATLTKNQLIKEIEHEIDRRKKSCTRSSSGPEEADTCSKDSS